MNNRLKQYFKVDNLDDLLCSKELGRLGKALKWSKTIIEDERIPNDLKEHFIESLLQWKQNHFDKILEKLPKQVRAEFEDNLNK